MEVFIGEWRVRCVHVNIAIEYLVLFDINAFEIYINHGNRFINERIANEINKTYLQIYNLEFFGKEIDIFIQDVTVNIS